MSALDITCPTCGALSDQRCRTLKTGRSTDIHMARWDARFPKTAELAKFLRGDR